MISGITLGSIYTFFFVFGLGFAVISAVFSSFGGHSDLGGHHIDTIGSGDAHVDLHSGDAADGHVDIHAADSSHLTHISVLSPLTISVFATAFGGFGILWQRAFADKFVEIGIVSGIIFGTIVAGLTFFAFVKLFSETQGTSNVRAEELIGSECDLTVGITDTNPIGQAVFTAKGRRQVSMAKSFDGKPIEKNRKVTIMKVDKHHIFVKE